MMINWNAIWMKLFHTTELLGISIGFWAAMAAIVLIVLLMNLIFWIQKPKYKGQ